MLLDSFYDRSCGRRINKKVAGEGGLLASLPGSKEKQAPMMGEEDLQPSSSSTRLSKAGGDRRLPA